MRKKRDYYFYVGYVAGTDIFKIGISCNLDTRKHTLWSDAPKYVKMLICHVHGEKYDEWSWTQLKHSFHYVITIPCSDKGQAKSIERHYRSGLSARKLCGRNGDIGDWFCFLPAEVDHAIDMQMHHQEIRRDALYGIAAE